MKSKIEDLNLDLNKLMDIIKSVLEKNLKKTSQKFPQQDFLNTASYTEVAKHITEGFQRAISNENDLEILQKLLPDLNDFKVQLFKINKNKDSIKKNKEELKKDLINQLKNKIEELKKLEPSKLDPEIITTDAKKDETLGAGDSKKDSVSTSVITSDCEKFTKNLRPNALLEVFNQQLDEKEEKDLDSARTAFITALKADACLGPILTDEAKTTLLNELAAIKDAELANGDAFKGLEKSVVKQFDELAGKLFDAFAKVAEKDENGDFKKLEKEALEVSTKESVKAFFFGLVKFGLIIPAVLELLGIGDKYLKSTRALKNEAVAAPESFTKMLEDKKLLTKEAQDLISK